MSSSRNGSRPDAHTAAASIRSWRTTFATAACLLTLAPTQALGQTRHEQDTASPSLPAGFEPQDILVTARRRVEQLQSVPIAVTAADGAELVRAQVNMVADLEAISPSTTFRTANIASSTANLIIRGLGTSGSNRSFEGSVGIFVDGVYRTRGAAALQNFVDIGEVQVLRGPQSTLFGKNTTAGAVLVSSTRPSLTDYSAKMDVSYGTYDTLLARATLNVPLSEHAALRIATTVAHADGYFTDVTRHRSLNGSTSQAGKAQLLMEPDDGVSIQLIGDYSRGHGNCCYATAPVAVGPLQPLIETLIVAAGGTIPSRNPSDREQSLNGDGNQIVEDYGATLLVEANVAGGTFKSTTGIRHYSVDQTDMDPDFSGADIFRYDERFRSRFLSQELTYSTTLESLRANLLLGAFVSDEQLSMGRRLPWGSQAQPVWDTVFAGLGLPPGTADAAPGLIGDEDMGGSARTYSAFVHADMRLNDRITLNAGVRYSIEDKTGRFAYRYYRPAAAEPFRLLGIQPGPAYNAPHHDDAVSGTLGVEYHASSGSLLYATYNHGFKSGGVNIDANGAGTRENNPAEVPGGTPLSPEYRPETIDAFEVGAKFSYLGGRARSNIALYYYDIKSLQIAQFVGTRTTVINAEGASDYGLELENRLQVTHHLKFDADAAWIPHARYGGAGGIDPVLAGSRFRFTPRLSANLGAQLDQPISDTVAVTGRVQYRFRSRQFIDTAGTAQQSAVSLVDASIGLGFPAHRVGVELTAQNLFNVTYVEQVLATPLQAGSLSGFLGAPRRIAVRVSKTF
jgi:iron complex outermembrane recepter protein